MAFLERLPKLARSGHSSFADGAFIGCDATMVADNELRLQFRAQRQGYAADYADAGDSAAWGASN